MKKREEEMELMNPKDIEFMNYGIINKYNFTSEKVVNVPIKRWDPLGFNYGLNEKYPQYTYCYGHYTYISTIRASRPMEYKADGAKKGEPIEKKSEDPEWETYPIDIIEPMVRGKSYFGEEYLPAYAIIISDDSKTIDNPFSDQPKIYPNLSGSAITMINRYPAMVRIIDPEVLPGLSQAIPQHDPNATIAYGVCLLTFPRKYYTSIQSIPTEEFKCMFVSMIAAINATIEYASRQLKIRAIPISPFINVGRMAGGSLKRIHIQVYMDLDQDGHGTRTETLLKSFEWMGEKKLCHLCKSTHRNRIILENDDWVIFATGSPIRNYHLRFATKQHIRSITELNEKQLKALASILKITFAAMDELNIDPNRNIIWNTRPFGYETDFHIFGDILPFEFVGGAEMADDMRVVRLSPFDAAKNLQRVINEKNLKEKFQ